MKQSISKCDFRDAFKRMGRGDQFSYEGLGHLFDYLLQYEEDTGSELELDVIGLCCEYSEEPIKEVLESYNLRDLEQLEEKTVVVWHDAETVIYEQF